MASLWLRGSLERPVLRGSISHRSPLLERAPSRHPERPLSGILTPPAINRDPLTHLILATSIRRWAECSH